MKFFLLVLSLLIKGHSVHKRATDVSSAEYIYNRHKKTYESEVGEMHLSCMQWPWFPETMSAFCYNFTPYSSLRFYTCVGKLCAIRNFDADTVRLIIF